MIKAVCLASCLILGACTTTNGSYGVIAASPMSLYNLAITNETVAEQVSVSSAEQKILMIPFGQTPKIDDMITCLVRQYQGDYMGNVTLEHNTISLLPFYHRTEWTVTGDVLRVYK